MRNDAVMCGSIHSRLGQMHAYRLSHLSPASIPVARDLAERLTLHFPIAVFLFDSPRCVDSEAVGPSVVLPRQTPLPDHGSIIYRVGQADTRFSLSLIMQDERGTP